MRIRKVVLTIVFLIGVIFGMRASTDVVNPKALVVNDSIIVVVHPNLPSKAILVVDPSVVVETLNLPSQTYFMSDSLVIFQRLGLGEATFEVDSSAIRRKAARKGPVPIDHHERGRFSWGADVGTSIDLTGQALSTANISISFGFSRKWINFLGFCAEAAFTVGNSARTYPLYANLRTNFRNRPSILFGDFKAGVALNYPGDNRYHGGAYAGAGLGCYLIRTETFSSHITLSYTFRQQKAGWTPADISQRLSNLHMASLKIGVMF